MLPYQLHNNDIDNWRPDGKGQSSLRATRSDEVSLIWKVWCRRKIQSVHHTRTACTVPILASVVLYDDAGANGSNTRRSVWPPVRAVRDPNCTSMFDYPRLREPVEHRFETIGQLWGPGRWSEVVETSSRLCHAYVERIKGRTGRVLPQNNCERGISAVMGLRVTTISIDDTCRIIKSRPSSSTPSYRTTCHAVRNFHFSYHFPCVSNCAKIAIDERANKTSLAGLSTVL
jgi:hypothetical protein